MDRASIFEVFMLPPLATANSFTISSAFQAGLRATGVDPTVLLRKSGLPLTLWSSGKGMVTTEQFFALWRTMGELNDDPAIGLKLARLIPVGQHHPVSMAALHAQTFRDALRSIARYKILWCAATEMHLSEGREECIVQFTPLLNREFVPPLMLDGIFAVTLELGRHGTGQPLYPLRVELKRNSAHRDILEAYYGCRVKFNTSRNVIFFRTADLDRLFITYDAELLATLGPQLEHKLAERKAGLTVAARVNWILLRLLGGHRPELGEVAKELGVSTRTLQRRIAEEGTSFRQLVSDARRELAKQYLLDRSLELAEAACLLGYEDPNSFYRAFREWEGTTPSEWRDAQRGWSGQNGRRPHRHIGP